MALMSESFSDKLFSTTIEVDFLFHPELEHKWQQQQRPQQQQQ